MMTSAQVVETSVNVNSPSQDYTHPDDHNLPNYDMTPGFKPFTVLANLRCVYMLNFVILLLRCTCLRVRKTFKGMVPIFYRQKRAKVCLLPFQVAQWICFRL